MALPRGVAGAVDRLELGAAERNHQRHLAGGALDTLRIDGVRDSAQYSRTDPFN